MGAIIITLQVTLLLSSFGFTEPSDLLWCFNDYDTELKCTLALPEGDVCSEHNLTASLDISHKVRLFECHFDEISPSACGCTMQIPGFVLTEVFTIKMLKGGKLWHTENFTTEESIKPRTPIITSVLQTTRGDFSITLNTTYMRKPFSDSLMVELTYGIDGSDDNVTKLLEAGLTTYEIVGRNLQPNSKYTLRARVKSNYHPSIAFSDYSAPRVFKTPPSIQSILKIIIPILCLILMICISSIYFWFDRILKPWWEKVPTPKFSSNFVKQVPWLLSFQPERTSVSVDSTPNQVAKETCVKSSQLQCDDDYSSDLGKSIDSAPLMYSTTCYESVDENSSGNVHQSTSTKNEQAHDFSSGISNRTYSQSSSSSFFKHFVPSNYPNDNFLLLLAQNPDPTIPTDFEYSIWNGCTDSGSSKLIQMAPSNDEMTTVLGYDSKNDHGALSSCNNPITEEAFISKIRQDVPISVHDRAIIPMDEGYQLV